MHLWEAQRGIEGCIIGRGHTEDIHILEERCDLFADDVLIVVIGLNGSIRQRVFAGIFLFELEEPHSVCMVPFDRRLESGKRRYTSLYVHACFFVSST